MKNQQGAPEAPKVRTTDYEAGWKDGYKQGAWAAQQPAPSAARPVTPYTCPKCHALWLHWPAEQTGFGRDTLNCRSADHCHYCEKAGVEQLQRLERVPAVLSAPQQSPTPKADSQAVLDSLALMRVVMRADEALAGRCTRGTTNWAAAIGKAVQDAVLAARTPADSVTTPAGGVVDGWKLAPEEPTLHMGWAYLDAARESDPLRTHTFNHAGYRAMLAAAPTPPAQAQAGAITPPPIECNTEELKRAYAFGWWSALEKQRETAQTVAVPLTHDEALDAFCHTPGIHQLVQAFMAGVRFAEQHHGIKGGQHGAE